MKIIPSPGQDKIDHGSRRQLARGADHWVHGTNCGSLDSSLRSSLRMTSLNALCKTDNS
jgi:hypothetical protein